MEIEQNIPIPPRHRHRLKYPFRDMAVGDSVLIPLDVNSKEDETRVRGAANVFRRRTGWKLTVRKSEGGFRVWRTE